jgi:glycosyltransferase involved in cell wall biosynthesis
MKKRVLIFCEFYRPGHKGGGAMQSVVNLVDRLHDLFEFSVVCRNHDGGNDRSAYGKVRTGEWNDLGDHWAYFVDPSKCTKRFAAKVICDHKPDVIFINSVFGLTTRVVLEARRKGWIEDIPVIIAPCGELSDGCLSIKPLKKSAFLKYAKLIGLYDGVIWKPTTDQGAEEIRKQFGRMAQIAIAPDIAPDLELPESSLGDKPEKAVGKVKLATVARIAPIKNIDYLLERLAECRTGEYELDLIGGVDDVGYWSSCERKIRELPGNVKVNIVGPVDHAEVMQRLARSHYFVLPTLSENFGYAFLEALALGCPILISENTIWSRVEKAGCGRVLRLDSPREWVDALQGCANVANDEFATLSTKSRDFAREWIVSSQDADRNAVILKAAIAGQEVGKVNVERA